MSDPAKRLYWALLVVFGPVLGYEALSSRAYGDNSTWVAVVFFGIAALSLGRLLLVGRTSPAEKGAQKHLQFQDQCLLAWM